MQELSSKLICIDPGHGGVDNGASYGFVDEDETNLAIGYLLDYELKALKIPTLLTREKDEYFSLYQRAMLANIKQAYLFVSIHCDAFHKETASGMTVHIAKQHSLKSLQFARTMDAQLKLQFPDHVHREIKESNFYVLSETKMPAILIECEFLSNPGTRNFLKKPENQRRLGQTIAKGIYFYLKG